MHNKNNAVVGVLLDEVDPMVSVMKVDKAPLESYADIGGLEEQVREMKEAVELPLTNPNFMKILVLKLQRVLSFMESPVLVKLS